MNEYIMADNDKKTTPQRWTDLTPFVTQFEKEAILDENLTQRQFCIKNKLVYESFNKRINEDPNIWERIRKGRHELWHKDALEVDKAIHKKAKKGDVPAAKLDYELHGELGDKKSESQKLVIIFKFPNLLGFSDNNVIKLNNIPTEIVGEEPEQLEFHKP